MKEVRWIGLLLDPPTPPPALPEAALLKPRVLGSPVSIPVLEYLAESLPVPRTSGQAQPNFDGHDAVWGHLDLGPPQVREESNGLPAFSTQAPCTLHAFSPGERAEPGGTQKEKPARHRRDWFKGSALWRDRS